MNIETYRPAIFGRRTSRYPDVELQTIFVDRRRVRRIATWRLGADPRVICELPWLGCCAVSVILGEPPGDTEAPLSSRGQSVRKTAKVVYGWRTMRSDG